MMYQKQLVIPVEGGCNPESYVEMVNCLPYISLGTVYVAKGTMRFTEMNLFALF